MTTTGIETKLFLNESSPGYSPRPVSKHPQAQALCCTAKRVLSDSVTTQQPAREQALELSSVLTTQWGLLGGLPSADNTPICLQLKHPALSLVGFPLMTHWAWLRYS